MEQRLEPLVRASGCLDYDSFAGKLRGPDRAMLGEAIIEAITTNETSFFRDGHPFDTFRLHILPWLCDRLVQARQLSPRELTRAPGASGVPRPRRVRSPTAWP